VVDEDVSGRDEVEREDDDVVGAGVVATTDGDGKVVAVLGKCSKIVVNAPRSCCWYCHATLYLYTYQTD
jgi:hypothetical protein